MTSSGMLSPIHLKLPDDDDDGESTDQWKSLVPLPLEWNLR